MASKVAPSSPMWPPSSPTPDWLCCTRRRARLSDTEGLVRPRGSSSGNPKGGPNASCRVSRSWHGPGGGCSGSGRQQGCVRTDANEGEPVLEAGGGVLGVAGQDAGGDAGVPGGFDHAGCRRAERGRVELTRDAECGRQIGGTYEQHVNARNDRDLPDTVEGAEGLDLDDADDRVVDLGRGQAVGTEATSPVVAGNAAVTQRWVMKMRNSGRDLVGCVKSGKHHSGSTHVENSAGSDPVGGFRADDDGDVVRGGGQDLAQQHTFASGAVFQVDQQPVESAERADLGRNGGSHSQECPDPGYGAGADFGFPADHGRGVPPVRSAAERRGADGPSVGLVA